MLDEFLQATRSIDALMKDARQREFLSDELEDRVTCLIGSLADLLGEDDRISMIAMGAREIEEHGED